MKTLQGKVVVITGAASGIGEALAQLLATRGAKLMLADVNADRLHTLRTGLRAKNVECSVMRVDVAEREAVDALADRARQQWGLVDVLINCAGVTVVAPAETVREADARWLMDVNFWGVWHGCRAFLPMLRSRPEACIVNLSSMFAMVTLPTQSIYSASKAAVRAYSDALRLELAGSTVQLLCVLPGGVKTNMARNARVGDVTMVASSPQSMVQAFEQLAQTSPEQAALAICGAIEKGRTHLLIGNDARLVSWVYRLMPARASAWFNKVVQRKRAKAGL